jgi:hypothetical protein
MSEASMKSSGTRISSPARVSFVCLQITVLGLSVAYFFSKSEDFPRQLAFLQLVLLPILFLWAIVLIFYDRLLACLGIIVCILSVFAGIKSSKVTSEIPLQPPNGASPRR